MIRMNHNGKNMDAEDFNTQELAMSVKWSPHVKQVRKKAWA